MLRSLRVAQGLRLSLRAPRALPAPRALLQVRSLASPATVQELDLTVHSGPASVARTEPLLEMGVCYPAGTPSPAESAASIAPILVEGMIAKCDGGGGPLGHPIEYIKLSRCGPPAPCAGHEGGGGMYGRPASRPHVALSRHPAPPSTTRRTPAPLPSTTGRVSPSPASIASSDLSVPKLSARASEPAGAALSGRSGPAASRLSVRPPRAVQPGGAERAGEREERRVPERRRSATQTQTPFFATEPRRRTAAPFRRFCCPVLRGGIIS